MSALFITTWIQMKCSIISSSNLPHMRLATICLISESAKAGRLVVFRNYQ